MSPSIFGVSEIVAVAGGEQEQEKEQEKEQEQQQQRQAVRSMMSLDPRYQRQGHPNSMSHFLGKLAAACADPLVQYGHLRIGFHRLGRLLVDRTRTRSVRFGCNVLA